MISLKLSETERIIVIDTCHYCVNSYVNIFSSDSIMREIEERCSQFNKNNNFQSFDIGITERIISERIRMLEAIKSNPENLLIIADEFIIEDIKTSAKMRYSEVNYESLIQKIEFCQDYDFGNYRLN